MKSINHRELDLSSSWLFQIEQWIALLVGLACIAAFVWATLDGQTAFSLRHLPHVSAVMIASLGWSLTIAVGLLGIALMRIAFYKGSGPEPDKRRPMKSLRIPSDGSAANSSRLSAIAARKWRQ